MTAYTTRFQALSFDADQTLWDLTGVYRKGLDAVVDAMIERGDIEPGAITTGDLFAARREVKEEFRGRAHRLEDVRERSFVFALERVDHPDAATAAAELIELYVDVRFDAIRLYPEVPETLARLKPHFKLGLLTNGNTYPERCGLPDMFDAEVFCPEYGVTKPDKLAFETLAAQLNVGFDAMLHIGDDWDDIEGANAVGATSVFINRTGAKPDWAVHADHEVTDLRGLERLLIR